MSHQPHAMNLIVQSGYDLGQVFAVQKQTQTIGRSITNDITLPEPSLSRQHARINATPGGFVVEDLGSANGTFVNGQRVTGPTPLRPGDILQLGNAVTFSVQPGQIDQDATYVPGASPGGPDRTMVPVAPPVPVHAPPARGGRPWVWVGVIVATVLIVGAVIGGLYYYLSVLSVPHTPVPTETVQTPAAAQAQPTQEEPPATATSVPTATPLPPPETVEIVVGGIPAITAEEGEPPENIRQIDAGCDRQVEIEADEPAALTWGWIVAADSETDYLAQWLEVAYYDVRLDGFPITELGLLRSYRTQSCGVNGLCGPAMNWWVNVGLLSAGAHHVTIEAYTTHAVSDGFDVEPADGEPDVYGPGLVSAHSCDIVVVEAITSTPNVPSTPPPEPTPTSKPVVATSTPVTAAPMGIFQDFESASAWKRGDQPYGEFSRSTAQVHSGSYAGQLSYSFPSVDNDYVVFIQNRRLAGRPNAISAWVYGDGSAHFLNAWIKDANGQVWGMTFGQVTHIGWQEMTAFLDPGQPWPSGHISGPNNGAIDYPISFYALVLDDIPDTFSGQGTIYIDDLNSQEGAAPPIPAPTPFTGAPTPTPWGQPPPSGGVYVLSIGGQHRYEEPWGAPGSGDPCEAWRNDNWDDENPNFRGFNVELLLANNSITKVQDDWGDNMRFFTAGGQEVTACYYGYAGAGPPPGGATSLTFFTVVPKGDFVQVMQLNLNGQFVQICLDGRGGWSPC